MRDLQSSLQHLRSLLVTCELLVAACGIYFSDQGLNLGPLHWDHGNFSHRATMEVPHFLCGIGVTNPDLMAFLDESAQAESVCQGQSQLGPGSWVAGPCNVPLHYTERNRGPELVPSLQILFPLIPPPPGIAF